jgi:hypothetical protein
MGRAAYAHDVIPLEYVLLGCRIKEVSGFGRCHVAGEKRHAPLGFVAAVVGAPR